MAHQHSRLSHQQQCLNLRLGGCLSLQRQLAGVVHALGTTHTSRLGSGMEMMRSKRPGRVSALSSAAGRLVAAMTTTPVLSSNPSISAAARRQAIKPHRAMRFSSCPGSASGMCKNIA
jgi:hypothetical protein